MVLTMQCVLLRQNGKDVRIVYYIRIRIGIFSRSFAVFAVNISLISWFLVSCRDACRYEHAQTIAQFENAVYALLNAWRKERYSAPPLLFFPRRRANYEGVHSVR